MWCLLCTNINSSLQAAYWPTVSFDSIILWYFFLNSSNWTSAFVHALLKILSCTNSSNLYQWSTYASLSILASSPNHQVLQDWGSCLSTDISEIEARCCFCTIWLPARDWISFSLLHPTIAMANLHKWRRKWLPTPVFLPGESHGWRSLAGYSPWGRKSQTWLSD